jgi:hypothetical protein
LTGAAIISSSSAQCQYVDPVALHPSFSIVGRYVHSSDTRYPIARAPCINRRWNSAKEKRGGVFNTWVQIEPVRLKA